MKLSIMKFTIISLLLTMNLCSIITIQAKNVDHQMRTFTFKFDDKNLSMPAVETENNIYPILSYHRSEVFPTHTYFIVQENSNVKLVFMDVGSSEVQDKEKVEMEVFPNLKKQNVQETKCFSTVLRLGEKPDNAENISLDDFKKLSQCKVEITSSSGMSYSFILDYTPEKTSLIISHGGVNFAVILLDVDVREEYTADFVILVKDSVRILSLTFKKVNWEKLVTEVLQTNLVKSKLLSRVEFSEIKKVMGKDSMPLWRFLPIFNKLKNAQRKTRLMKKLKRRH
jgi:hypothetical protein